MKDSKVGSSVTHTPGPWTASHQDKARQEWSVGSPGGYPDRSDITLNLCKLANDNQEANAKLIASAPDLLKELETTNAFALELMERAAKIDRMLLEAKGQPLECELGEVVRLRQQLGRNRAAISKATA